MSSFVPEKEHLQQALLFLFNQKKKAVESHGLVVDTHASYTRSID